MTCVWDCTRIGTQRACATVVQLVARAGVFTLCVKPVYTHVKRHPKLLMRK
jgi:hypothetical protein